MKRNVVRLLVGLFFALAALPVFAQTQAILPNAETTFVDANGAPYAGGKVYTYVPNTLTPKGTYADPYGATLNPNPVVLDANGRAIIWGSGVYREVLQDQFGNTIWDQLTYTSPVGAGSTSQGYFWFGTATGTANAITLTGSGFTAADGQTVGFLAGSTNTGSVTINASGYGSVLLEKNTPGGVGVLSGGEIVAGSLQFATYSASANAFVLQGPVVPYTSFLAQGVTGTANAWVVASTSPGNYAPALGTTLFVVPPAAPNTGAVTVTVGGTGYQVYRYATGGIVPLAAGAIPSTSLVTQLLFDGTRFEMVAPNGIPASVLMPSGAVMGFDLTTCPAGWVNADGTNSTVNMLGVVARGYDPGATRDPAGASQSVGSYEADTYQQHTEASPAGTLVTAGSGTSAQPFNTTTTGGYTNLYLGATSTGQSNSGSYGVETRAKATIVLYCQKS